ncbi:PREDICTED: nuclear pore complex protein Nup214-like [Dinoponera quadriceps]|uniref:Nuclear pore complex protein Nup214-like n=1 Tax=Dinoponera quadriceps TaxID=609295 RepID=A0A6P3X854_DINQU|nr:PREDICTED: nuclear pore complex protein Nup214-like [Dinoponera quadriceps]
MWNLGNRAAVVLICVTCGCVLVYNAWGAILALILSLLVVVYACYSLLANDSLVFPQETYRVFVYLREAIHELRVALEPAVGHVSGYTRKLWRGAGHYYRERFPLETMDGRRGRGKSYQLSSDSYDTAFVKSRDSLTPVTSRFSPIGQSGQIRRDNDTTYHRFCQAGDHERSQQLVLGKHTSTPVLRPGDREDDRNGDIGLLPRKETSSFCITQSHTLNRGENITQFSPEGSPWGASISPKMRPRPAGMKTVQTVAGPLLASTRYNIDPKMYADVSSPGLTTRLTKYATEAKSKLTHQSHYGTGQFPKVNLYANPVPLLNTKSTKMRMPVTVRLAPPEVARYSPPERQRILSNIRHTPNNKSTTNVVQVLREISLKRHASREDVTFDVAKKQRTEDLFDEETEMVLEETKQKRARDDSRSEEELSPQNISIRPAKKRTKTQSCYDILNSLSSSIHVSPGVKRKAIDFSRSGTPEFEKHFKSLKSVQTSNSSPLNLPQSQNLDINHSHRHDMKEIYSKNLETITCDKVQETLLTKGILKMSNNEARVNLNKPVPTVHKVAKSVEIVGGAGSVAPTKSVKLTDKLFMRDEPERNAWLKVLAEEQVSVKPKFTKDNVEEIKKEDIRNMRQTSMKARLQSMFDAISGKAESKINPDVVIQADDVNAPVAAASSASGCASLNSSTTTTTVNTTPISTAAIVPGGTLTSKPDAKSPAFSSPASSAQSSNVSTIIAPVTKGASLTPTTSGSTGQMGIVATTAQSAESSPQKKGPPTFVFGKPIAEASPAATSSPLPGTRNTFNSVLVTSAGATPALPTFSNFLGADKTPSSSAFAPVSSSGTTNSKLETSNAAAISTVSFTAANTQASPIFAFGAGKLSVSSAASLTLTPSPPSQFTGTRSLPANTNAISVNSFNSVTSHASNSGVVTTPATTTTSAPLFSFGGSGAAPSAAKAHGMFGQASNAQPPNVFGSVATSSSADNTSKSFSFTANAVSTTTSGATPAFGLPTAPTFSLSTPATSGPANNKPLFVFGAGSLASASATTLATTASGGAFGTVGHNVVQTFGTPTTTTVAAPQFGIPAPSSGPQQFGAGATPRFGTPTTSGAAPFGATTTSVFGSTPAAATSAAGVFGTAGNSQQAVFSAGGASTSATSSGMFNPAKTTAASIFAAAATSNATSSEGAATSGNLFSGGANAAASGSTVAVSSQSSMFVASPVFGQAKPPTTSFGAGGTAGIFGNTSTPLFGSTTSSTAAGFANNVSTSSAIESFGASGATNAPANTSVPAFGIFSPTDSTPVALFGASQPPAGGAFAAFGAQNSASLTFGDNKPLFGATSAASSTAFGGSPMPAFGADTGSANSNASAMFFGSNQKDGQQQAAGFGFASTFNAAGSNPTTVAAPAPFQFGATTAKPAATGFNFTAPSPTPTINFGTPGTPAFNPSTPGMFSIGSGSTAPRSRAIRTRKPR